MWVCADEPINDTCPDWVELIEYGPLGLPPLTVQEGVELGGLILALWVFAVCVAWVIRTVNR